jgi:DNA polymerase-3 subunit chi
MPHNIMEKGMECETPISLTSENENPNNANILITVSGANAEDKEKYDRVLDIFEGSEIQRTAARKRWQTYKEEGAELAYFANEGGKWVKKA